MITKTEFFNKKILCAVGMVAVLLSPAFAADNNGCNDVNGKNDRINAEIALCSTHVYNIGGAVDSDNGAIYNFRDETNKQLMRNVIALKTTVMTQQMYKQYEYLESMIRRFKTQLEKAVLTTKLQAAGADTSVAGNSSYSGVRTSNTGNTSSRSGSNKYVVLEDAKNCRMTETTPLAVLQCLLDNIRKTLTAVDDNDLNGARRQLEADLEVAQSFQISKPRECVVSSGNAKNISACAYALQTAIMTAIEEKQQAQNRQNYYLPSGGK